ncbi:MAG TPA: hypothetical protein VN844_24250 [Pyrinomonadaceae bacterium]|nr:hypothetical protein [Pyrinomonadaceae bacterium]
MSEQPTTVAVEIGDDLLRSVFERAAEMSKAVPESLREAAFNRAVDALLGNAKQSNLDHKNRSLSAITPAVPVKDSERDVSYLLAHIDRTAYPAVSDSNRVLDRALHVLRIANNDFGVDGLGSTDIARILTEKFRLRTTRQAVAQALDSARKFVDRSSGAGRTKYRIMAAGERYLDSESSESPGPANLPRKVAKNNAKKSATKSESSPRTSDSKRSRSRIGPRATLNQLVADGYFNEARRISGIQTHLAETKAHTYKVTDLSPTLVRMLRDDVLVRERGEDGQYEYRRK